jgi:hypothetical protein
MIWTVWTSSEQPWTPHPANKSMAAPRRPVEMTQGEQKPATDRLIPWLRFETSDDVEAKWQFRCWNDTGLPHDRPGINGAPLLVFENRRVWRWRGVTHFLKPILKAVGITDLDAEHKASARTASLGDFDKLAGSANEYYWQCLKRQAGIAKFSPQDQSRMGKTLDELEKTVVRMFCMTASVQCAVDEARQAIGQDPPVRAFQLLINSTAEPAAEEPVSPHADPGQPVPIPKPGGDTETPPVPEQPVVPTPPVEQPAPQLPGRPGHNPQRNKQHGAK